MKISLLSFVFALGARAASEVPTHSFSFSSPSVSSASLFPTASASASSDSCAGNTATNRQEWCDYDINTDYTTTVPDTGVTREYWFDLQHVTVAPDGRSRFALAINGSIPGPTIYADWGDTVVVHVTNSLPDTVRNGTSVHFHGIRQYYTNQNDGVVSITQCPTAPNSTITYRWRAMQYGTTWYHSHIGLQAWEGLFGGIVINGPASSNYDEDKGVLVLNDWDINTVDELYISAQTDGPPTLDTALINGTNVFGYDGNVNQTGYRFNTSVTEGTSYRLRLINAAMDTHFKFMIDNHTLTVISNDLVPIEPYNTTVLNIAMGQRYDVVVQADKSSIAKNFWMRAIPQEACSENENPKNIKGIVYYGDSPSTPTTSAYSYSDSCDDEDMSSLVPLVNPYTIDTAPLYNKSEPVSLGKNSQSLYRWKLNSTSMHVDWADPTLLEIYRGHHTFANSSGVVQLPRKDEWVYVVIETTLSVPHPIHLHGHDFLVLAQGSGTYDGSVMTSNPPRRDTAMLPASGHLVVGFQTDNPGAWLMHCHIGWHTAEGFAIQFVERYDEARKLIDYDSLKDNCDAWGDYQDVYTAEEDDSGV
ncbi:uncharacterized protein LDX57_010446 [Aspergillus melleus]|uniref:uncharacterized protein n=1 Tax=Aspergillus melleus TaxID=138277 RepID=UPI001E8DFEE6|nr:uncharacterized protein LDX57_010446 [Aspergillus melleus]KAH8432817.1 hypothetical protein LDX57_010446 [Aspergillus melleus]